MLTVKYMGFNKTRIIEAEKVTYEIDDGQSHGCDHEVPFVRAQLKIGDERDFGMFVVPQDFQFNTSDQQELYCHTVIVENSNGKTSDIIRGGSYEHHPGRKQKRW